VNLNQSVIQPVTAECNTRTASTYSVLRKNPKYSILWVPEKSISRNKRINKDMDTSKSEQWYKMKIEELEKKLDSRNLKIDSLAKELKLRSDELSRQIEKHQIVCEARDESKFRVVQLEKDVAVLRKENDDLMSQLNEQKIVKNSKELSLEAVVASCADQIKKYEEKIEAYEIKFSQLETSTSVCLSEKSFEKRSNVANNEDGLKILQLESDIKLLSLENEDLKSKLKEEKERKNSNIKAFETHIKSCTDQLQKYEQTIKDCESKITYLETKGKEMVCRCEEHLSEIKNLQTQLEIHQNCEKKLEEEKLTVAQLQKELENLKSLETTEIKIMPSMGSVTREVIELQECKDILKTFSELQRNLQMKFEHEMKDKLQQIEETISKEHDILNVKSPENLTEAQLPKAGEPEEWQESEDISAKSQKVQQKATNAEAKDLLSQKIVKPKATSKKGKVEKDQSLYMPIKTQNKRTQNMVKTEVKDLESPKTVKPNVASTSEKVLEEKVKKEDNSERTPLKPQNRKPQKPTKTEVKKNKKIKDDENVYSSINPKDSLFENMKTAAENVSPIPKQGGRQLRTRRKV
ncbi:Protein of unknown function, partial [Gryllus bimaculatus]